MCKARIRILLAGLMRLFMTIMDVFSDSGAHFIDSPHAFPRYKFLQTEFTAQYTETNMKCHFINLNIYFRYSKIQSLKFHD
jgi:hypothetical protein